jgi:peptide chain release factor subunit 3
MLGVDLRHALLVKSNGINKLVVVVNKMDDREYGSKVWDSDLSLTRGYRPSYRCMGQGSVSYNLRYVCCGASRSPVYWLYRYDEIVEKLTLFLKSVGYNPKTDITFIPVSAFTGAK